MTKPVKPEKRDPSMYKVFTEYDDALNDGWNLAVKKYEAYLKAYLPDEHELDMIILDWQEGLEKTHPYMKILQSDRRKLAKAISKRLGRE